MSCGYFLVTEETSKKDAKFFLYDEIAVNIVYNEDKWKSTFKQIKARGNEKN